MDRLTSLLDVYPPETRQVDVLLHDGGQITVCEASSDDSFIYLQNSGCAQISVPFSDNAQADISSQSGTARFEITMSTGDLIWIPGGHQHQIASDSNGQLTRITLAFGDQPQNILLNTLPALIHIPSGQHQNTDIDALVRLMCFEAEQQRCAHSTVLNCLSEVLLVKILRYLIANRIVENGVLAGLGDSRLSRTLSALHAAPGKHWNLDQMASEAGMSRTAFSQHFKQLVMMTPADYLTHWRMRIACKKLLQNKLSIGQIAEQLGYQSETAFRRAFRKTTGVPPGEYKKQYRSHHQEQTRQANPVTSITAMVS